MGFREDIKAYAKEYWTIPCKDNIAWTYYTGINTLVEIQRLGLKPGEWKAAFLNYSDAKYGKLEGLYLIKAGSIASVKAGSMDATLYPERKMLSSWYDAKDKENSNAEVLAQKPKYNGLNDCAHFATQCLLAGGIDVQTTGVPTLLQSLRARSDVKTLALTVNKELAENMIKAKIMDAGDVIIYSLTPSDHHHSTVYMGNEKIAMHTWANHPDHPTIKGDWKPSASTDHPLVTLIHFGRDDTGLLPAPFIGWWQVVVPWSGKTYYYYFRANGSAGWTSTKPASVSQSIGAVEGTGYWFVQGASLLVCWTKTGTFEKYDGVSPTSTGSVTGQCFASYGNPNADITRLF